MLIKPRKQFDLEDHSHTSILFKNGYLVDPNTETEIQNAYLVVACDKIAAFGDMKDLQKQEDEFNKIVDCKGMLLSPGLIDMQVHFRDPGQTHKEDIITGSKAAVKGGITSVVCQPNTSPVLDSTTNLDYLCNKAKQESFCNIFTYASITQDLKGSQMTDMIEIAKHPIVVGFTDDGLPVMNSLIMRKAFENSEITNKVISQHAEDIILSNKGCINEGFVSAQLGVKGIHNLTESLIVERDIRLCEHFGGRYHVLHISTKEAIECVKIAKIEKLNVTCEASPHHLLLDESEVLKHGTMAKMNPPLRSKQDVETLQQALFDGTIDVIATDHAPHDHLSKEKSLEEAAFGIVGVETMLTLVLEFFHNNKISLTNLLKTMTCNPAKILGIDRGNIQVGKIADLTLIDLNKKWIIDSSTFESKSKNTPFDGREVKGKAVLTMVGGEIVYSEL
jgi:dihydroorotase